MIRKYLQNKKGEKKGRWILLIPVFLLITFVFQPLCGHAGDVRHRSLQFSSLLKTKAPIAHVEVKNIYPHDSGAFTQGFFVHQGFFYESTGLYGRSSLEQKEIKTGRVLQSIRLSRGLFGEGIVLFRGKIYQLTWQNQTVLIYDAKSFREINRMKYEGEGWGLASDGRYLMMSNGSSTIAVVHPKTFKLIRNINVHDGNAPVDRLNEMEFVRGEIWANIYMEDLVVRISPKDGKVTGWIDLSVLRSYLPRHAPVDVINGIAYDDKSGRIYMTGKYWPHVFEIQLSK